MDSREIVKRAIEFKKPPRLPFYQHVTKNVPDDVFDTWEMDRAKKGWFFTKPGEDDWGCVWRVTKQKNMGQVMYKPLEDLNKLSSYKPPNPKDSFYFERLEDELAKAGDRYVLITCHFNLFERLYMLHGFNQTLEDFYYQPEKIEKIIDMILEFKVELFNELHKRFGDRVDGLYMTDDWGTQNNTFISNKMFEDFFLKRYRILVKAVHSHGWHYIQHSCGKINEFIPYFIDVGVDMMNICQPKAYGIKEIGNKFAGKIAFLTTADIQTTLPSNDHDLIREEVKELIELWSTNEGGMVVFGFSDPESLGVTDAIAELMLKDFWELSGRDRIILKK